MVGPKMTHTELEKQTLYGTKYAPHATHYEQKKHGRYHSRMLTCPDTPACVINRSAATMPVAFVPREFPGSVSSITSGTCEDVYTYMK